MDKRIIIGVLAVLIAGLAGILAFADRTTQPLALSDKLRLEVNQSERTLSVIRGDEVIETYPVTVGTAKHPTPKGSFAIDRIIWNPSWTPPDSDWARDYGPMEPGWDNPMGRVKMFFQAPTYYIHGTRTLSEIGEAASHGCVRMSNANVLKLARVVMEEGGEPRPPNWFKRVINSVRDTREVRLQRPVAVIIR